MGKVSTSPDFYEKPGKRQFTRLILALAAQEDCRTFGGFWGHGGEAIEAAAAGLDVLAVDNDESVADEMRAAGATHGIAVHVGNVRRVKQHRDIWHADFMDTPKPENFKTLRHISTIADKWIAVTLATDHIKNTEMQGESLMATLPAWLTFACRDFTLEYFAWYRRHDTKGLRMWVALLQRRAGHGNSHRVQPVQIAMAISERGYWASVPMHDSGLVPHSTPMSTNRRKASLRSYYQANRARRLEIAKAHYQRVKDDPERRARNYERTKAWRKSDRGREWCREWAANRRKNDPEWVERKRQYKRDYYRRKKAAVSGTAAEAISSD